MKRLCFSLVPGVIALGFLASCAAPDNGDGVVSITKVNPYYLKPGNRIETDDEMIRHEQRYHTWGAITNEDFAERFGHYYTIHWGSKNPGSPATTRLEDTQANTGPTVHTQEVEAAESKRRNKTHFRVTGEEYSTKGPVNSWKVSIVVGGQTVAESKSFLWK